MPSPADPHTAGAPAACAPPVGAAPFVPAAAPFVPAAARVLERRQEAPDVVTLWLEPPAGGWTWRPGQFHMLTAFGVGEVAISISDLPGDGRAIRHTVRDVGAVTHALCASRPGTLVGVRGPYGTDWGLDAIPPAADVVVVAGGIGLAPLRGAVAALAAAQPSRPGRLFVAIGARLPDQVAFADEHDAWAALGATVRVTVDAAPAGYDGRVGLVTALLPELGFDPAGATALVCGPEVMMRFVGRQLVELGLHPDRIAVSLERNMQCGAGLCGHCQLGPLLLCRDGPVVAYPTAMALLREPER